MGGGFFNAEEGCSFYNACEGEKKLLIVPLFFPFQNTYSQLSIC